MDISFSREPDNTFLVRLGGNWNTADGLPSTEQLQKQIGSTPVPEQVAFDTRELGAWDSSLLTFVSRLTNFCGEKSIRVSKEGLPGGLARLIALAAAVPQKKTRAKRALGRRSCPEWERPLWSLVNRQVKWWDSLVRLYLR